VTASLHHPCEVLPPSRRGETGAVLRAAAIVVAGSLLWIGGARSGDDETSGAGALLPFQASFVELEPALQRAVREMQEGAIEAMRARGGEGKWPDAARLAAEGVPPFADDGVDRGRRLWTSSIERYAFQYLGVPAARGDGTAPLLIQLLEPPPGDLEGRDPRIPLPPDEQHRRLADGTLLHVSFWVGPRGSSPPAGAFVKEPALEGFLQVLSGISETRPAARNGRATR
jgi:hypothetical protein